MSQVSVLPAWAVRSTATRFLCFECTLRDGGRDAAWVRVTGELDLATAPILARALSQPEARGQHVVLDLRELTFIDSSGVHVILQASLLANAVGRRLVLVRGSSHVDRVLSLTEASDSLEIVDLHPVEPPVLALLRLAQRDRAA